MDRFLEGASRQTCCVWEKHWVVECVRGFEGRSRCFERGLWGVQIILVPVVTRIGHIADWLQWTLLLEVLGVAAVRKSARELLVKICGKSLLWLCEWTVCTLSDSIQRPLFKQILQTANSRDHHKVKRFYDGWSRFLRVAWILAMTVWLLGTTREKFVSHDEFYLQVSQASHERTNKKRIQMMIKLWLLTVATQT
jgi:hypothetical protein